jgi:hypothetical protein
MATMWTYPFRIAQRPPHPAKLVVFLLTADDRTGGALVVKVQFGERREWTGLERTNIADFPPSADPKSFSKGGIMRHAMILFLTSVVSVSFSGCGPSKAEVSKGHMGAIGVAISQYKETYNRWPDELEQLLPFMNNERICFANPLTGDDPGYEYVKPEGTAAYKNFENTVVLYQLRDGKRDEDLPVLYLNWSIRPAP